MLQTRTKIGQRGRVVIPARYRRALGLKPGDEVVLALEEEEVRLFTPMRAVQPAQTSVRRYVPEGRSLAQELLAERRMETRRA